MKKRQLFLLGIILATGVAFTGCQTVESVVSGVGDFTAATSTAFADATDTNSLRRATNRIGPRMARALPEGERIAVLNVQARSSQEAEFVIGQLEHAFVNSGRFQVASRSSLDAVMMEQDFQLSGNVSDSEAVAIGRMTGANIVVTGTVSRAGRNNSLVVRAIDIETAQILAMEQESFR